MRQKRIHKVGPTAEVTNAYEASNAAQAAEEGERGRGVFTGWRFLERTGEARHVLEDFGPCTVSFDLRLADPLTRGRFGVSLWDRENRIVWGAASDVDLARGDQSIRMSLPYLPLKPGPYTWRLSLADGNDVKDVWFARPSLQISTVPRSSVRTERWTGLLNLPYELRTHAEESHP